MSTWNSNGPILIRVDDGVKPQWVNPALIERVFETEPQNPSELKSTVLTKVHFASGDFALFTMPMTDFFTRLSEATAAKYGG